ncbi:hypothetical protein [Actinoallomurus iriomotensis]|uniref:IrrE N-terminal-like domain-containing protein n=1 Tax=Actinoallomurus iriomotensis TaxID=478107 RepID=A0A9W6RKT6_9ACTN|nr:hypothetical protein [Actinoallomurus iriomotensis]GLY75852.1 hypothetical protein Airi01_041190 [Actinoallomurus iriomotensis]
MDFAALTERCRTTLAALDLPRPFDVHAFCERLGRDRGRPLSLLVMDLPPDAPCGLWVSTEERDYIVYERATTPLHQEHIILHEVAHLLCGHVEGAGLGDEHARRLFPSLSPGTVRRVLGRGAYSSEEEQEAELLASMILQRAGRTRRSPRVTDPDAADHLRRLESGI